MSKINVNGLEIETERKYEAVYIELKEKIVKEMFSFTNKYANKGENCLYPECGQILIDVLQACLNEAQAQMDIYKAVNE